MADIKQDEMTRVLLESAVDKGMRDIERDSKRSIRKLVDLGAHFSREKFTREFFLFAQQLLRNQNSAYYSLVKNAVADCDRESLKRFGINLGYNSWIAGARRIRALEKERGYNIPWLMAMGTDAREGSLGFAEMDSAIAQGKQMGIYTYIIGGCDMLDISDTVLLSKHDDCAFMVLLPPSAISPETAVTLLGCKNVCVSVNAQAEGFAEAADELRRRRCIFAAHRVYDDCGADEIVSGKWAKSVADSGCLAIALIASSGCSRTAAQAVREYVYHEQTEQQLPAFIFDLFADTLKLDKTISVESCCFGVTPDGYAVTLSEDRNKWSCTDENIRNDTLEHIFSRIMPRAEYAGRERKG